MRHTLFILLFLSLTLPAAAQNARHEDEKVLKAIIENEKFQDWFRICDSGRNLTLVDTGKVFKDGTVTVCSHSLSISRQWPAGLEGVDAGTLINARNKIIVYAADMPKKKGDKAHYIGFWEPVTNYTCVASVLRNDSGLVVKVISRGVF